MSAPTPSRPKPKPIYKSITFWLCVGFVLIAWGSLCGFAGSSINVWRAPDGQSISSLGQFGDTFGALNTLFAGLAFIGVVFTLYRQHQDGLDADERHDEALKEQARITKVQGLTALMNNDAEEVRVSASRIRFLISLNSQVDSCAQQSRDTLHAERMAKLRTLEDESLAHLDMQEYSTFHKLIAAFRDTRNRMQNLKGQGGNEGSEKREKELAEAVNELDAWLVHLMNESSRRHTARVKSVSVYRKALRDEVRALTALAPSKRK